MKDDIGDAVGRCLKELGFRESESRNEFDVKTLLLLNFDHLFVRSGEVPVVRSKSLEEGPKTITRDFYVINEVYENRQGVHLIRWDTGYKGDAKDANGKPTISKILKYIITFKVGDDEAGLAIFPERKDEKLIPYSNLGQLQTDLRNMFRNAWPTSEVGDYLRTVYHRLLKYAQPTVFPKA